MKKILICLCFVFLFTFFLTEGAFAATIYANSSTGDDSTGDGSSGTPYKTFTQAYTSASSGDTIDLTGTFDWINGGETTVSRYGFIISKNLTIQGQGAGQTFIQGNSSLTSATNRRVFTISSGYDVTMNDLTVRYGYLANYSGGGIEVDGTLLLDGCNLSYNYSGDSGGGIEVYDGDLTIRNSLVDHNTAVYQGGGVHTGYYANGTGTADIINSTIAYNAITYTVATIGGGGVAYRGSGGTITNSTIAYNNMADGTADGAGIFIYPRLGSAVYVKNSIIAGNLNGGVALANYDYDIELDSGTFVDNGNNIIGKLPSSLTLADSSFVDTHTYNGADNVFDSVDYGTGSLYLDSSLADNSASNSTQTLAITDASSIAIDHGSSSANQGIDIPSTDQRGFYRTAVPDIGAYEYDGTVAIPTYTLTYTAGANGSITGDTTQTVNSGADGTAVTAVPNSGYRFVNWSDSSTDNPRTDTSVTGDISVTANFQDATGPVLSAINVDVSSASAEVSWTTDENADSKVEYGITSNLGSSETSGTLETSHSLTLSSLNSCATYYFKITSEDGDGNSSSSDVVKFYTTGCSTSSISQGAGGSVNTGGGSISLSINDGSATITAPDGYLSQSTTMQINKLNTSSAPTAPAGLNLTGDNFFEFLSILGSGSLYENDFDKPISLVISYGSSTEGNFTESTLGVYKYVNGVWENKNCTLDTAANTLTCSLPSFSTYAVFGEQIAEDDEDEEEVQVKNVEYEVEENTITVRWETNRKADSRVRFGLSPEEMDEKKKDDKSEKKHKIVLKDLLPNTKYFFRAYSEKGDDNKDSSKIYSAVTEKENDVANKISESEKTIIKENYNGNAQAKQCSYIVQEGDSLWSIAKEIYGDATAYPLIIENNKEQYPDIISGKLSLEQELSFGCETKKEESLSEGNTNDSQVIGSENVETQENESHWWNPFSWF